MQSNFTETRVSVKSLRNYRQKWNDKVNLMTNLNKTNLFKLIMQVIISELKYMKMKKLLKRKDEILLKQFQIREIQL